jgi:hypothetical protein
VQGGRVKLAGDVVSSGLSCVVRCGDDDAWFHANEVGRTFDLFKATHQLVDQVVHQSHEVTDDVEELDDDSNQCPTTCDDLYYVMLS